MADQGEEERVRFLTYNINFGLARIGRDKSLKISPATQNVLRAILESEADIVALQETNQAWQKVFDDSPQIRDRYPNQQWFHAGAAGGSALLSRGQFPIVKSEALQVREEVEGAWFDQLLAKVEVKGRVVQVVGVHLRPPKGMMWWTSSIRKEELEYSLGELKKRESGEEGPMVVLGDFNEDDGYSALQYLEKEYNMGDALGLFVPKKQETMEVDVPMMGGLFTWTRKFRLDHICFSRKYFECLGGRVLEGYREGASDHQPVVADLKFK